MDEPIYHYKKSYNVLTFDFESIGVNGVSRKKVIYSSLEGSDEYFSLSLFEVLDNGVLDVYFESNNGDMPKIMATIVRTMFDFFATYPTKKIAFSGSTPERTRLYRIVISKLVKEVHSFTVEGLSINGAIVDYLPNENYLAYVISLNKL
jgi:hypothetical protein